MLKTKCSKYLLKTLPLFISLLMFSYNFEISNNKSNINFDENSKFENKVNDNSNKELENKEKLIEKYNNHQSSNLSFNLYNSYISVPSTSSEDVKLSLNGNILVSSNMLDSYHFNSKYEYNNSNFKYSLTSKNDEYSSINYDNKTYLINGENDLSNIISFPSTINSIYPISSNLSSFATLFNRFLSLDSQDTEVDKTNFGYQFKNQYSIIKTTSDFEILEVKNSSNSNYEYDLKFQNEEKYTTSSTNNEIIDEDSNDVITTILDLLKGNSLDIDFDAEIIDQSKNLNFVGNLKVDYTSFVSKENPVIDLSFKHYLDNKLSNDIDAYYDENELYFRLNDTLKGKIKETSIKEIVDITSGLTDSSFSYDLNNSLNQIINTSIFENLLNFDISSLNFDDIKNFEMNHSLISLDVPSYFFGIDNNNYIHLEVGLQNLKLKTIVINNLIIDGKEINASFRLNEYVGLHRIVKSAYSDYNTILPIYRNLANIIKEGNIGGYISSSIFKDDVALGFSSQFDLVFKDAIQSKDINDLKFSLQDLDINYIDSKEKSKSTSSQINSLFLLDTKNVQSKNKSFSLSIDKLDFLDNNIYINLEGNKMKTSTSSISKLFDSINTLKGNNADTTDGIDEIKEELKKLDFVIYYVKNSSNIKDIIENIKNNYAFNELDNLIKVKVDEKGTYSLTFNIKNIVNNGYLSDLYSLQNETIINLSQNGNILGIEMNELSFDGIVTSTSISSDKFNESNFITPSQIQNDYTLDLDKIIDASTSLINQYSSYSNTTMSSLFNINLSYDGKKLLNNAKIKSKVYFDEDRNVEEKYIEGNFNLSFDDNGTSFNDINSIEGLNLNFVYSDKNKDESKFYDLVNDNNRLYNGSQFKINLDYGSNDERNNTSLYGYSSNDTINNMLDALSDKITSSNALYPYQVVRETTKYAQNIKNLLNMNTLSTSELLNKLNISDVIRTLTLNNEEELTIKTMINLRKLDSSLSNDIYIILSITLTKTDDIYSIKSIDIKTLDYLLKMNLDLVSNEFNIDTQEDIISGFETYQYSSNNVNYISASNLYNLLDLGIYTTERKYYNIKGVLRFSSNVDLGISGLNVDNFIALNNLDFDIKLNLYKDPKPSNFDYLSSKEKENYYNQIYSIKAYLKIAPQGESEFNYVEFMIKEDKIYIYKSTPNATLNTLETTTTNPDDYSLNHNYDIYEEAILHLDLGVYKENGNTYEASSIFESVAKSEASDKIDELAETYHVSENKNYYFSYTHRTTGKWIKTHYYGINVNHPIDTTLYTYKKYNNDGTYKVNAYWLKKDTFLGNCTLVNDNNESIQVPRLMYYILDYSQVIKDTSANVKLGTWKIGSIQVKNLMLANIMSSITSDSSAKMNYLKGWEFNIENDEEKITKGYFYLNPNEFIQELNSGTGSITFNCGIRLDFKILNNESIDTDSWEFTLYQDDTTNNIITASMGSMELNLKIEISTFSFLVSNNETLINNEMERMDSFIEEFNSNENTKNLKECYVDKIETSEYSISLDGLSLKVDCKYIVSYNNSSNEYFYSNNSCSNLGHLS